MYYSSEQTMPQVSIQRCIMNKFFTEKGYFKKKRCKKQNIGEIRKDYLKFLSESPLVQEILYRYENRGRLHTATELECCTRTLREYLKKHNYYI
jgi:hypothetical protein